MSPTVSTLMVSLQSLILLLQKIRPKHEASNQVTTMLGTVIQVSTKFVLSSCDCLQPLAFINSSHPEADESVSITSFLSYTSLKNLFHYHEWLPAIYCRPSFPPHPTLLASIKLSLSSLNFLTCHLYHKFDYITFCTNMTKGTQFFSLCHLSANWLAATITAVISRKTTL